MDKLNPEALAEWSDEDGARPEDVRQGVQAVTPRMIAEYVISKGELPRASAEPFGQYLHEEWNDYVEDQTITNGDVIAGALEYWRGNA